MRSPFSGIASPLELTNSHSQDRTTNVAKACFNLKGQFKWCLSGTPLQNRVGELYSLVRFLGGDPYSYYFCKNCPCKVRRSSFRPVNLTRD